MYNVYESLQVWDAGLAVQAQQWADNCLYEHPNKALYKDYANIGQNLFIQYPDSLGTKPPSPVTKPVTSWHNEVDYYDYYSNSCRPKKVCGHYTQVNHFKLYTHKLPHCK